MGLVDSLWRKLTQTKALEESSGKLETLFFESVYRVTYLAGLSSSDTHPVYRAYSIVVKLSIILFVSSELWYLVSETSSMDKIIDNINVTLIHFIAIYRYKKLMDHKDKYKELAKSMESPHFDISTPKRKKLVQFWVIRNERYLKLLLGLGTCTLAAWYVYPLVDDLEYNLSVAVRLPIEYRTPSRYPLAYIVVLITFHYISYFVIVNDLVMQAHLMHLLCQFAVLADCFENIINDCDVETQGISQNKLFLSEKFKDKYLCRLNDLVDQHKFILHHATTLKKILSTPMLGQLAASSMLICFAGYQVATTVTINLTKFVMSLLYLGYSMFELFIFCRWCDEIKIQSENIRLAVYCSGWERGIAAVPGIKTRLMLIVARANKPMILTAGGLYDLSLNSYTTVVKTSYSALTVLLRLRQE
uniref:Odorant receptor n=1 Tax=Eogystia hippophaecolus TaxID=1206364 RepID=A0A1B3P5T2_EOGHI|nr:odorant receptor [Eogystia hippophaecolus]